MRGPNIPRPLRFTLHLNDEPTTFAHLRDSLVSVDLIFPAYLGFHIF